MKAAILNPIPFEVIGQDGTSDPEAMTKLARDLNTWWLSAKNRNVPRVGRFTPTVEGRSQVEVVRLEFLLHKSSTVSITEFIIRHHKTGKQGQRAASMERRLAGDFRVVLGDRFSCELVNPEFYSNHNAVVYHLSVHDAAKETPRLGDVVAKQMLTPVADAAILHDLAPFMQDITGVYENHFAQGHTTIPLSRWFNQNFDTLPPDLVITLSEKSRYRVHQAAPITFRRVAPTKQFPRASTVQEVLDRLQESGKPMDARRLNLRGRCMRLGRRFASFSDSTENKHFLIRCRDHDIPFKIQLDEEYYITIVPGCARMRSRDDALDDCGFHRTPRIATDEDFIQLFHSVVLTVRHRDLHSGNIVILGNRLRAIDVVSVGDDLLFADIAKLEVSLWHAVTKKPNASSPEWTPPAVRTLLECLEVGNSDRVQELGSPFTTFYEVLHSLRKGTRAGLSATDRDSVDQEILAYTIALLRQQRYLIQDFAIASPGLREVTKYWFELARGLRKPKASFTDDELEVFDAGVAKPILDELLGTQLRENRKLEDFITSALHDELAVLFHLDKLREEHALLDNIRAHVRKFLSELDPGLNKVDVPHIQIRIHTMATLIQAIPRDSLYRVACDIGRSAASDLVARMVKKSKLPKDPQALIACLQLWDKEGNWGDVVYGHQSDYAHEIWKLEIHRSCLGPQYSQYFPRAFDVAIGREYWRGYLAGFVSESLLRLGQVLLSHPYDSALSDVALPIASQVTNAEYISSETPFTDRYSIRVEQLPIYASYEKTRTARALLNPISKEYAGAFKCCKEAIRLAMSNARDECSAAIASLRHNYADVIPHIDANDDNCDERLARRAFEYVTDVVKAICASTSMMEGAHR